ncbi:hypothetical protein J7E26_16535 [Bacillus sp. ISL-51]|nr:hypothetical protein [Bacillus sp. ISL-51]
MVVLHVYSGLGWFMKQVRRKDLFLSYADLLRQLTNNCEKQTKNPSFWDGFLMKLMHQRFSRLPTYFSNSFALVEL